MKKFALRWLVMTTFAATRVAAGANGLCNPGAQVREFVVAPDGLSPSAALAEVRAARQRGELGPLDRAAISVRPGTYWLNEPLTLTADDSHVAFAGARGVVFSGGLALGRFVEGTDGVWRVAVPNGRVPDQLYVNGRRAEPARSPNSGYFYMSTDEVLELERDGRILDISKTGWKVADSEAPLFAALTAEEIRRVLARVYASWDTVFTRGDWYDPVAKVFCGQQKATWAMYRFYPLYVPRYVLMNYRGALDEAGEWFFDVGTREILYLPRGGESTETATAVVPSLKTLIAVAGVPKPGGRVQDVVFSDIALEHASCVLPEQGFGNSQAGARLEDAAIDVRGGDGARFDRCVVRHVGAHGVWFHDGTRNSEFAQCLVEDAGASAVRIGDGKWDSETADETVTAAVTVRDSILRNVGVVFEGAVGVHLAQARDCSIEHNDISYVRYTGVSLGWTWSETRDTPVRNNHVDFNRFRHIGMARLNDMGAIYSLGRSDGTTQVGNWISDVTGYKWGVSPAWGIYWDEGSSGILTASNRFDRVRDGFLHQNYGHGNVFAANWCNDFEQMAVWRSAVNKDHITFAFSNNVFVSRRPEAKAFGKYNFFLGKQVLTRSAGDVAADRNVWAWPGGTIGSTAFNGADWGAWRADGHDAQGCVTATPPADPSSGVWRQAGVRGDAAWKNAAEAFKPIPYGDETEPPRRKIAYRAGFEAGMPSTGLIVRRKPVGGKPTVYVTSAKSRTGRLSLCVEDREAAFYPYLEINGIRSGRHARLSFSIAGEEKTHTRFAIRDGRSDQLTEGFLLTLRNGVLSVPGRVLAKLEPGQWCDVEIEAEFDNAQARPWKVTVRPVGGSATVAEVPNLDGRFRRMTWIVFTSDAKEPARWWLDDLSYLVDEGDV